MPSSSSLYYQAITHARHKKVLTRSTDLKTFTFVAKIFFRLTFTADS